jgi:hypothetical protein
MTPEETNLAAIFDHLSSEYNWKEQRPGSGELFDKDGESVA